MKVRLTKRLLIVFKDFPNLGPNNVDVDGRKWEVHAIIGDRVWISPYDERNYDTGGGANWAGYLNMVTGLRFGYSYNLTEEHPYTTAKKLEQSKNIEPNRQNKSDWK